MNLEERREFLRERAVALLIVKKPAPPKPISPRLQKWRKRMKEQPKQIYRKPFFSLGIAMDDYQPVWVRKADEKPKLTTKAHHAKSRSALSTISEKLRPTGDAPDEWWSVK